MRDGGGRRRTGYRWLTQLCADVLRVRGLWTRLRLTKKEKENLLGADCGRDFVRTQMVVVCRHG